MNLQTLRSALLCGLAALLCLDGVLLVPFALSGMIQLMGLNMSEPPPALTVVLLLIFLAAAAGGGALWGWALQRLTGRGEARRMAQAGALSFAPLVLGVALTLGSLEPVAAEVLPLPIHRVFTVMFVPAVFLVVAVNGWALGQALQDRALSFQLALSGGLMAALAFAAVNLTLDAFGFRVGAPFAAQRATMLVTAFSSNAGAALLAGAVMGAILMRSPQRTPAPAPEIHPA